MANIGEVLKTAYNLSDKYEIKREVVEDVKFNLEDLHHSIDIKEECESEELTEKKPGIKFNGCNLFECAICGYIGTRKSSLKLHLRTHSGEKPFLCQICDYKCTQKSNLERHLKTHTGEKPFACPMCKYKSIEKSKVKMHLISHTSEKAFACEICNCKFTLKANLNRHLKTHIG